MVVPFAQNVPDDLRVAIDLLAPLANRPQLLDHDLGDESLVVDASDLRGAALVIDARDRRGIGEQPVKLKEIADIGIARIFSPNAVWIREHRHRQRADLVGTRREADRVAIRLGHFAPIEARHLRCFRE